MKIVVNMTEVPSLALFQNISHSSDLQELPGDTTFQTG